MLDKIQKKAFSLIGCEPANGNHIGATQWCQVSGLVETLMKDYVLEWESRYNDQLLPKLASIFGIDAKGERLLKQRFVTYDEYIAIFDNKVPEHVSKEMQNNLFIRYPSFVLANIQTENQRHVFMANYSEDLAGYLRFMREKNPELWQFFADDWHELRFPLSALGKHMYMVGMTGCGKTEIFKALIMRYVIEGGIGGLVLDLDGDFAQQVAMFKENAEPAYGDRLIYINPFLDSKKTPVINPFDLPNKKQFFNEVRYTEILEKRASQIQQALVQIFKDFEGNFTDKMEGFLYPAICITLLNEKGDLNELLRLFDEKRNFDLIELGKRSPSPMHSEKFANGFTMPKDTRDGITNRLSQLLDRGSFRNLVSGKSTIDLKAEIEAGKLIVINIPKRLGIREGMYFGKFVFSVISSAIFERSEIDEHLRKPVLVFVDEFQNLVNDDFKVFLNQARKFESGLNLASQTIGQEMSLMIRQSVGGNTFIKIGGQSVDPRTIEELASYFAIKPWEVEKLPEHIFKIRVGKCMPFTFYPTTAFLKNRNSMTAQQWESVREKQLKDYYSETLKNLPTKKGSIYDMPPEKLPKDLQVQKQKNKPKNVPKDLSTDEQLAKLREQKEESKKPFNPKYGE